MMILLANLYEDLVFQIFKIASGIVAALYQLYTTLMMFLSLCRVCFEVTGGVFGKWVSRHGRQRIATSLVCQAGVSASGQHAR